MGTTGGQTHPGIEWLEKAVYESPQSVLPSTESANDTSRLVSLLGRFPPKPFLGTPYWMGD